MKSTFRCKWNYTFQYIRYLIEAGFILIEYINGNAEDDDYYHLKLIKENKEFLDYLFFN